MLGAVLLTLDRYVLPPPDHTICFPMQGACVTGEEAAVEGLLNSHTPGCLRRDLSSCPMPLLDVPELTKQPQVFLKDAG